MLRGALLLQSILGISLALTSLFAISTAAQVFHDPRKKEAVGFSADLEYPADMVVSAVKRVASDTSIHGSRISTKDKGMEIEGAEFAASSKAFRDAPASNMVFYKIKLGAVAPVNFPGSNGAGTVAVRYVIQPLAQERTRLLIDSVFYEDSLHTRCFSDGSVETAEYAEVVAQLKSLGSPKSSSNRIVPLPAAKADTAGLQNTLAGLQARLTEAKAAEQELEKRVQVLKFNNQGQVKSQEVPLKAFPYNHSSTVVTLEKGETVTILATAKYWYRVRTPKGEEGWIYYVFLGPLT